jgi:quinolinate synthase
MSKSMTSYQKTGDADELIRQIGDLKRQRDALILAHNYQRPEVQDIADHTGDSLELSRTAAKVSEALIVFCGVQFMAETAAILCPEKTVLLPVREAGCPLADTATAGQIRQMREQYPDAIVVAYVNTSAEVKAESDVCCTSANAVEVVRSVDAGRPIIFVSDRNLGHYAASMARRRVILWDGACPTHAGLSVADIRQAKKDHPETKVMAHPECRPEVLELTDRVAGTAGMLAYAAEEAPGTAFIVGTDIGLIHRLKKESPDKVFYPATDYLVCPTMKLTTLEDVMRSLENMEHVVTLEKPVRVKARSALDAMLAVR